MTPARLKKVVEQLSVLFPPFCPVIVQRTKKALAAGEFGDVGLTKRGGKPQLLVRLNANYDEWVQLAALLHEWAHCVQWRPEHQEERRENDHDAEWGVIFARIWGTFFSN